MIVFAVFGSMEDAAVIVISPERNLSSITLRNDDSKCSIIILSARKVYMLVQSCLHIQTILSGLK